MPEDLIDWSQAESILGVDGQSIDPDMAEIFHLLKSGTRQGLADFSEKQLPQDVSEIRALAHRLRGSVLNFGFVSTAAILQRIELEEIPSEKYLSLVAQVNLTFQESIRAIEQRYPSLVL